MPVNTDQTEASPTPSPLPSLRRRQLQATHAIAETGTVTGAAEQLGIYQPGISNLLYQLERETHLKLIERCKGCLIPAPGAGVLFREVDTVVRGLDHAAQAVTDLQNKQAGQLQVASQHSMSFGFMPALIARFARTREVFQQAGIPLNTRMHSQLFKNLLSFVQKGIGSILDPFVLDFEGGGGFVSRPFRRRIMMEMAVVTPQITAAVGSRARIPRFAET